MLSPIKLKDEDIESDENIKTKDVESYENTDKGRWVQGNIKTEDVESYENINTEDVEFSWKHKDMPMTLSLRKQKLKVEDVESCET